MTFLFNKTVFVIIFLIISHQAGALEADNYYSWNKNLSDSLYKANNKMNLILDEVILEKKTQGCSELAKDVYTRLEMIRDQTNANWNPFRDSMIPERDKDLEKYYREESIYRKIAGSMKGKITHLAGTIEMDGVRFGVDKIAHFALIGYKYYEVYQKELAEQLKKGKSILESSQNAKIAVLEFGIKSEKTYLGLWFVTFSYADLEANYQGLIFYNSLCEGAHPFYVKNNAREWVRSTREFNWNDYISGDFDETYNSSGHKDKKWKKIKPYVKQYCPMLSMRSIQDRFSFYQNSFQKSESQVYMEEKEKLGQTPQRKKIERICSE